MNKTIIININGIIFHIEEEAYTVLQNYMVGVKRHFGNSVDSNEIVSDIENRIAEMFSERLNPQKAVIEMHDVKEVCAQMGEVEDFDLEGESSEGFEQEPYAGYEENRSFFRDTEDKVFGGVCSGLGYYLDIEAKWMRLIFLVVFLFAGTGLLIYIVLWIAIPKAKTRADRMRMRGQSPNIENFKRNFKEEMGEVKNNLKDRGERIKNDFNDPNSATSSMVDNSGKIGISILKVLGGILIFFLIITLLGSIISLFVGASLWSSLGLFPAELLSNQTANGLLIAFFFTIGIPILLLILLLVRVIFNREAMNTRLAVILFIAWLVAVGFSTYYFSRVAFSFIENEELTEQFYEDGKRDFGFQIFGIPFLSYNKTIGGKKSTIQTTTVLDPQETFSLKLLNNSDIDSISGGNLDTSLSLHNNKISLKIEPIAIGASPKLIQEISSTKSERRSRKLRERRKESYHYLIKQIESILWFPDSRILNEQLQKNNDAVEIKILLPINTRLVIDKAFENEINILGLNTSRCKNSNPKKTNETEWIMTENGLVCLDDISSLDSSVDTLQKSSI